MDNLITSRAMKCRIKKWRYIHSFMQEDGQVRFEGGLLGPGGSLGGTGRIGRGGGRGGGGRGGM